jgi:putative FmdB family regulatory protein
MKGGANMPNYEFRCQNCRKKYSLYLSIKDREERKYKCPKCGSRKSQPVLGGFFAKTSKKS